MNKLTLKKKENNNKVIYMLSLKKMQSYPQIKKVQHLGIKSIINSQNLPLPRRLFPVIKRPQSTTQQRPSPRVLFNRSMITKVTEPHKTCGSCGKH